MPLYEYRCSECGGVFELVQKFSDEPASECLRCGGGPVEKLISASSFHLKGSGWYQSDYAAKGEGTKGGGTKQGGAGGGDTREKQEGAGCGEAKKPECSGCPSAS